MRVLCPARQVVARRLLAFLVPSLVPFRPLPLSARSVRAEGACRVEATLTGFRPAIVRCDEARVSIR